MKHKPIHTMLKVLAEIIDVWLYPYQMAKTHGEFLTQLAADIAVIVGFILFASTMFLLCFTS